MSHSGLWFADRTAISEDRCIGASARVMANVGVGSTIGAGAVVTRAIPSHAVADTPARVIKELT